MTNNRVRAEFLDRLHQEAKRTGDARNTSGAGGLDIKMRVPDEGSAPSAAPLDHRMDQVGSRLALVWTERISAQNDRETVAHSKCCEQLRGQSF
jgi:hypothetical protein